MDVVEIDDVEEVETEESSKFVPVKDRLTLPKGNMIIEIRNSFILESFLFLTTQVTITVMIQREE
jgi:hypothetical protein